MMKYMTFKKYSFITLIYFISLYPEMTMAAIKKTERKASSKSLSVRNNTRNNIRIANNSSSISSSTNNQNTTNQTTNTSTPIINEDNCEFYYNLCMNKFCANNQIGKCVCYEDKYTNSGSSVDFLDFNGNKIKKGFDLFEYSKKQCLYILDQCMENRRAITEKYKTLVQRDCLLVSKQEVEKDSTLSSNIKELKNCARDYCTAYNDFGAENFNMPEFGLCFDEDSANMVIDSKCSSIIAKSPAPLSTREYFLNEMALKREEACKHMNGQLSSDRKSCYINVSYGMNKDNISASKNIPVGEFFYCNQEEFDTNLGYSFEYLKKKKYQALTLTANSLRTAGNITATVLGTSPIADIAEASINTITDIAYIGIDISRAIQGKMSKEDLTNMLVSKSASYLLMPALSIAGKLINGGSANNSSGISGSKANPIDLTKDTNAKFEKAGQALSIASSSLNVVSNITDIAIQGVIDDIIVEKEKSGVKDFATFQNREQGVGKVNQTNLNRGNCFINGEWVGTENEIILLQWQL